MTFEGNLHFFFFISPHQSCKSHALFVYNCGEKCHFLSMEIYYCLIYHCLIAIQNAYIQLKSSEFEVHLWRKTEYKKEAIPNVKNKLIFLEKFEFSKVWSQNSCQILSSRAVSSDRALFLHLNALFLLKTTSDKAFKLIIHNLIENLNNMWSSRAVRRFNGVQFQIILVFESRWEKNWTNYLMFAAFDGIFDRNLNDAGCKQFIILVMQQYSKMV